jgi:hypothetical protein
MEKRHRYNLRVGGTWLVFVMVLVFLVYLIGYLLPTEGGAADGVGLLVFLFGSILFGTRTRLITSEEHALEDVASALSELEEHEQDQDPEHLELVSKKLRLAGRRFRSFGTESAIYSEALRIREEIERALRKKLPYLLTQTNGLVVAKQEIGRMRSVLLSPTLEGLKGFAEESAKLPEEPPAPSRKVNWGRFIERRPGQIVISILAAVFLPPLVTFLYALLFGLNPLTFIRDNPAIPIGGFFVLLAGFLAWLGRK